ncbi:MAG: hypothetical protein FWE74_06920 [Oscillospiraceae bacterium]|nr:hypothetical protein [Oscillospiraceae bacterium]
MIFIKFLANIAIFVIAVRFVTLILDKIGIFRAMERFFGKRDNNNIQVHDVRDYEVRDADEPTEPPESDNR